MVTDPIYLQYERPRAQLMIQIGRGGDSARPQGAERRHLVAVPSTYVDAVAVEVVAEAPQALPISASLRNQRGIDLYRSVLLNTQLLPVIALSVSA